MTLAEFIASVCKEVLEEVNHSSKNSYQSIKKKTGQNKNSKKRLVTEKIVKEMIEQGTINTLDENVMFTPSAKDIWKEYKNKR